MASAKMFLFIVLFVLGFNMLIALWGITTTNVSGITMPSLPASPSFFDYVGMLWDFIVVFWDIAIFTIFGLPVYLSFIIVSINIAGGFILLQMIRGN